VTVYIAIIMHVLVERGAWSMFHKRFAAGRCCTHLRALPGAEC